jgi:hypothetical protein
MTIASTKLVFIPALLGKPLKSFPLAKLQFIYVNKIMQLTTKKSFFFQRATEGTESAVYKKLIAPLKNDMPVSDLDGVRMACADHKYAYIGPKHMVNYFSSTISCQLVQLPGTYYLYTIAFIISRNNPFKGLINWR